MKRQFRTRICPGRVPNVLPIAALCAISLIGIGCGGESGIDRYAIEGRVTYENAPVAAGQIIFEPDTEKGNSGPAAMGPIENGRYAIPADKGVVGGPHLVRVIGHAVKTPGSSEVDGGGEPPFSECTKKVEFEKKSSTLDLKLDSSSIKAPEQRQPPASEV